MMKTKSFTIVIASIILLLTMPGCRVVTEKEAMDFIQDGWESMDEGRYSDAVVDFGKSTDLEPMLADAWNGLGWAYARLNRPDTSVSFFNTGENLNDQTQVGTEILAGRAFSNLALGEYLLAINDANGALDRAPTWVFRRDPSLTFKQLTLTVATAHFSLGDYASSLTWVQRLDAGFLVDVETLSGLARLSEKLEALKDEV
ncbi:tetratricopeptide repeat protein [Candidatus Neomarinimicrobiota bacterium]